MEEILTRRTLGALRGEDPWPDLIIIDGGKWQLGRAVLAIQKTKDIEHSSLPLDMSVNISPVQNESKNPELWTLNFELWTLKIISLAKRIEEVFLPKKSNPILLEKWSPELMILQKIRDEAHRFAINYNRSSREKSYTKTLLDEIPWIGPVARQKILKSVSKIEELSSWTFEKSQKLFWKKVAETLQNHGLIGE
jgi:excinuclease ABC subunit C